MPSGFGPHLISVACCFCSSWSSACKLTHNCRERERLLNACSTLFLTSSSLMFNFHLQNYEKRIRPFLLFLNFYHLRFFLRHAWIAFSLCFQLHICTWKWCNNSSLYINFLCLISSDQRNFTKKKKKARTKGILRIGDRPFNVGSPIVFVNGRLWVHTNYCTPWEIYLQGYIPFISQLETA